MTREIVEVKKNGRLIAFGCSWQYWLYNHALYYTDGVNIGIWCTENRLAQHLHRLYQLTGRRFFTEGEDMMIVDKNYLKKFEYA